MNPRQIRHVNDYKGMIKLREQSDGMFDFRVDKNYQHYVVTISKIETLVGTTEKKAVKQRRHVFTIDFPPEYPNAPPNVRFEKPVFHPNWYASGKVCYGPEWAPRDLSELVIDTVKMMLFEIVAPGDPANGDANEWYKRKKESIRSIIPKIQFPPPYSGPPYSGSELEILVEAEEDGLEFY